MFKEIQKSINKKSPNLLKIIKGNQKIANMFDLITFIGYTEKKHNICF